MQKAKKKRSFAYVMLSYAVIFICILVIGLIMLWRFIEAYEKTRASTAMQAYMEDFSEEKVYYLVYDFLGTFDNNIQSREEIFDGYIKPYLSDVKYSKNASESTETKVVYNLLSNQRSIGKVTLEQNDKEEIGFRFWDVTNEEMDFSFIREEKSESITVPETFTVECNGYALGGQYVTGSAKNYESLKFLEGYGFEFPAMLTYTVDNYLGKVEFRIFDENGTEYPVDSDFENIIINDIMNNCTQEEKDRLATFLDEYCRYYVGFMGSHRDMIYTNYGKLKPYLLPGSDLANRMNSALEGMVWSNNKSNELQSVDIHYCIKLESGEYLCDVTYFVNTLGNNGYVVTENDARIIVVWLENGLFAKEMMSY